jgi:hypothetical protein
VWEYRLPGAVERVVLRHEACEILPLRAFAACAVGAISAGGDSLLARVSGANAVLTRTTDIGAGYPDANYAVFSGLSGDSKTIICDIPLFGGIAAFQIVPNAGSDTSVSEYWTMYQ